MKAIEIYKRIVQMQKEGQSKWAIVNLIIIIKHDYKCKIEKELLKNLKRNLTELFDDLLEKEEKEIDWEHEHIV